MKKTIPIGHEDFKRMIESDLYYVDKSLLVKDLVDNGAIVSLVTRPRRFGKTLNLSMIRRFFEDERTKDGKKIDNASLFHGLKIMDAGEKYLSMQEQYPVISFSLKSAKQPAFDKAYYMIKQSIIAEFQRHCYVLESGCLPLKDKRTFEKILNDENDEKLFIGAVQFLSKCLELYHEKRVIILIDEYDVPLENAYFNGFYDEMTAFIRSLFESALKTNSSLEFGMVTGCLRISRESIFTGLNNLYIQTLRGSGFGESFGFTQKEVEEMLNYYGLNEKRDELQQWYDGYCIDGKEIYNPWSVLNYIKAACLNPKRLPEPYWVNTSSSEIIRELIEKADEAAKDEIEQLLSGSVIEKPVHEDITYEDIHKSMDNLWNFLFFTGYLKSCGERMIENQIYMKMAIPNKEVASIYEKNILSWFDDKIKSSDLNSLYAAIENGDADRFSDLLTNQLQETISFFDYGEDYYHAFLAGILTAMPGYMVLSNRESGTGRADLVLKSRRVRKGTAFIFELKVTDRVQAMESKCNDALQQIEAQNYADSLLREGYENIIKYGVCFYRKECMVKKSQ